MKNTKNTRKTRKLKAKNVEGMMYKADQIGGSQVEILLEQRRLNGNAMTHPETREQLMAYIFDKTDTVENPLDTDAQKKLATRLEGFEDIMVAFENKIAKM